MPKILIFEDDDFLAGMYATKLRMNGFSVAVYNNPSKDPVRIAVKEKPDLISSGIIMPVMDGFDALKKLKADERTKDIPVVLLSNLGQQEDFEKGKAFGAVEYLVKANHSPTEVVEVFYRILGLPIPPEKPILTPKEGSHSQSAQKKITQLQSNKPWWKKLFG